MHTQYIQPVNPNQFVNTSNGSRMQFTPHLTVSPNMQPYVQPIGALLIDNIQNGANTSVIRQALYHRMAQNGFFNKEFTDLLQFAVEYAEVLEYMDRLDGRTAQIKSVEEITQIAAAAEVTLDTTHRLWNAMPPEMQQHVQSWQRSPMVHPWRRITQVVAIRNPNHSNRTINPVVPTTTNLQWLTALLNRWLLHLHVRLTNPPSTNYAQAVHAARWLRRLYLPRPPYLQHR